MIKDRAETPEQKKEVMNRILVAWLSKPELRLEQLIENALYLPNPGLRVCPFYVEDYEVVRICEEYVKTI